jgi:hypothetical protein
MEHALTNQEAAILAAAQATEATAELLRYAREGASTERYAFHVDVDVPAKLAEALKLAIEIEGDPLPYYLDKDELAHLAKLKAAINAFLAGWVG